MPIYSDPERAQLEQQAVDEEREFFAQQAVKKREHEYRIAKLKHGTQTRLKTISRVMVAIVKGPACLVLAITIPRLVAKDKEVPQALLDFINL